MDLIPLRLSFLLCQVEAAPLRAVGRSDEMVRGKSAERCLHAALITAVLVLTVHLGICAGASGHLTPSPGDGSRVRGV